MKLGIAKIYPHVGPPQKYQIPAHGTNSKISKNTKFIDFVEKQHSNFHFPRLRRECIEGAHHQNIFGGHQSCVDAKLHIIRGARCAPPTPPKMLILGHLRRKSSKFANFRRFLAKISYFEKLWGGLQRRAQMPEYSETDNQSKTCSHAMRAQISWSSTWNRPSKFHKNRLVVPIF